MPAWKPRVLPVSVATTRYGGLWGEVGHQMYKFEQVSGDRHQMSLAGVGLQVWCKGEEEGGGQLGCRGSGYRTWTFLWGVPTMWPIPWCIWCYHPPPLNRRKPMKNITIIRCIMDSNHVVKVLMFTCGKICLYKVRLVFHNLSTGRCFPACDFSVRGNRDLVVTELLIRRTRYTVNHHRLYSTLIQCTFSKACTCG